MAESNEDQQKQDVSTSEEPNQLEKKIIRQVEFYFGDRNLAKDKFLQEKLKENEDGWIGLDVLLTFNRLKSLSTDSSVISQALRKSTKGLIEVNEGGDKVRRTDFKSIPTIALLSPEVRKEIKERTVYLKGFPEDSTLDDIQEFLLEYGETDLIQMRKYLADHEKAKQFKGSVFAEFKSKSSVEQLCSLDEVKYKDNVLIVETKEDYFKRQNIKRKGNFTAQEPLLKKQKPEEKEEEEDFVKYTGAVLHFKGCGKDTNREQIKEYFRQYSDVGWVEFRIGDEEGYVRFDEKDGAKKAFDSITGSLKEGETPKLGDDDTELRIVEGQEEIDYWKKMISDQNKKRKDKLTGRQGHHKRGNKKPYKRQIKQDKQDIGED